MIAKHEECPKQSKYSYNRQEGPHTDIKQLSTEIGRRQFQDDQEIL